MKTEHETRKQTQTKSVYLNEAKKIKIFKASTVSDDTQSTTHAYHEHIQATGYCTTRVANIEYDIHESCLYHRIGKIVRACLKKFRTDLLDGGKT